MIIMFYVGGGFDSHGHVHDGDEQGDDDGGGGGEDDDGNLVDVNPNLCGLAVHTMSCCQNPFLGDQASPAKVLKIMKYILFKFLKVLQQVLSENGLTKRNHVSVSMSENH